MSPAFGTSGLRGLSRALTDAVVDRHVRAFLQACPAGGGLYLARDRRASSPRIARAVARAARAAGLPVTDCGLLPTPALALAAAAAGQAAIIVTGSHIPGDRNGLKFFTPAGEITKADEGAISSLIGQEWPDLCGPAALRDRQAGAAYVARYVAAYGKALAGMRLALYAHSAVGHALLARVLSGLGAEVQVFGASRRFVALDTEAVGADTRARLAERAAALGCDAIVSTDGDGDRPLLTDAEGRIVPGDILGQITAAALGATTVVTPVTSNTGAELSGRFDTVIRTRVGSPHVVGAMATAGGRVLGYEANGGVLLGFDAGGPAGRLPRLMTRDAILPIVATLTASRAAGGVAPLVAREPARFTASDRLRDVPVAQSARLMQRLGDDRSGLLTALGAREAALDRIDGIRITLERGRIVHLRPSGNAPEFRIYAEAEVPDAAEGLVRRTLAALSGLLAGRVATDL